MTDDDQPTTGLRVGGWLPPIPGLADGADATDQATTDGTGHTSPRTSSVTRHAHVPQDLRAMRALAGLLTVAVAVAVLVYLIASSTVAPSRGSAPPVSGPSGPGVFAPGAGAATSPAGGGQLPPRPGQPGRYPPAVRSAAPAGGYMPAPGGGVRPALALTQGPIPQLVNLTEMGSLDWIHFGQSGSSSVDRKRNGSGAIRDLGSTGVRGRYPSYAQWFSWSDGQPTASVTNSATGVYVCGSGGTFTLAADAGPDTRTLRLYAGVRRAQGRLTATLSSGSSPATAYLESRDFSIGTTVFTVTFQAPAGSQLLLRWTTTADYDPGCGGVSLQAATLG